MDLQTSPNPPAPFPAPLRGLAAIEQPVEIAAGDFLFVEGDTPRGAYLVHTGKVNLIVMARDGSNRVLRVARPGDLVGLGSAISGKAQEATAQAADSCSLGFLEREELLHRLQQDPQAWLAVLALMSADINDCYDKLRLFNANGR